MQKDDKILLILVTLSMVLVLMDTLKPCVKKLYLAHRTAYDVIVVGADPEGVSAAVSSARNGMKTLLVDGRYKLGGLWTLGGLNFIDMNFDPKGRLLTRGVFEEFYREINRREPHERKVDTFDIQQAEIIFDRMVDREPNLACRLKTPVVGVLKHKNKVTGILINDRGVVKALRAKRVIDSTQDANVAAMAGAHYCVGMADFHQPDECQPMTLVFEMEGVDWERLKSNLRKNLDRRISGADEDSAWGFMKDMRAYKPMHKNIAVRGMNIGRMKNGRVLINSMLIMGVNPLNLQARRRAMKEARSELPYLAQFIRSRIPGFESARLAGAMPEMYVRESRHIVALYKLRVNDLIENKDFPDKIAAGSYALDIQRTSIYNHGYVLGKPAAYSIPFRCLVPKGVDNLLVVGRCAGYDSFAHSSARVVPVGMATGQAAGVACYYSVSKHMSFANMWYGPVIGKIQRRLQAQRAYLEHTHYPIPYNGHWALGSIRYLRDMGLIVGGYRNDYKLDARVPSLRVVTMALKSERRSGIHRKTDPPDIMGLPAVNTKQAAQLLLYLLGKDYKVQRPLRELINMQYITPQTAASVSKMHKLTNAGLFLMLRDYTEQRVRRTHPGTTNWRAA